MKNKRTDTKYIIVHCSDSDCPSHDNPETIRKWHVEERGFSATGYPIIITKDGEIHTTDRHIAQVGAHCRKHNHYSVGICLTGRYNFTDAQFEALVIAIDSICAMYNLDYKDVYPHNYFDRTKTCPNFSPMDVLNKFNN